MLGEVWRQKVDALRAVQVTNKSQQNKKNKFSLILWVLGTALVAVALFAIAMFYTYKNPIPPRVVENNTIRIATVGDSITYGDKYLFRFTESSYPVELQRLLGQSYQVLNYGIPSRTAIKTADYPYWNENYLQHSMQVNPEYVIIMLGTNDSKPYNWDAESYRKDLKELVELYKNLENQPKIFLMTPSAAFIQKGKNSVVYNIDKEVISNEILPIVVEIADDCQVSLIDIYAATVNHPEYFKDGVHPNDKGKKLIASLVYNAIMTNNSF